MSDLEKRSCVICAWRENCQKRFTASSDIALRCPDYVRDVTLKKKPGKEKNSDPESGKT